MTYGGEAYQVARDELPNLYNNRLRARLFRERPEEWAFFGRRNPDAFERLDNGCEERPAKPQLNVLSRSNIRAIGMGLEFRDMIAMAANIANEQNPAINPDDAGAIRKAIVKGISTHYAAGKGVFKGGLEDGRSGPRRGRRSGRLSSSRGPLA